MNVANINADTNEFESKWKFFLQMKQDNKNKTVLKTKRKRNNNRA